jgi:hypothetical protein
MRMETLSTTFEPTSLKRVKKSSFSADPRHPEGGGSQRGERTLLHTHEPRWHCGADTTQPPKHFGSSSRNCSSTSSRYAASEP